MKYPPTFRQLTILYYLSHWIDAHAHTSPTFRELARYARCSSVRTVTEHITALRRKGFVTHTHGEARTLFLTAKGIEAVKAFDASAVPEPCPPDERMSADDDG